MIHQLPVPVIFCSAGLDILKSYKGRNASTSRHNNDSIELENYHTAIWGSSCSESTVKEGSNCAGCNDRSWSPWQIGLVIYNRCKVEYVWNTENPLGCFLVPCPVIKANWKLQQLNSGKTINGPEPSGMKIWVMPLVGNRYNLRYLLKANGIQNR